MKYAIIKLNDYFQKQKEIIEKVYLSLQIVLHKGCFLLAVFPYETIVLSCVHLITTARGNVAKWKTGCGKHVNQCLI